MGGSDIQVKKIIVASFQRSGTHFLINNMSTNFVDVEDGWVDVVHGKNNRWVTEVNGRNLIQKIREQLLDVYYPNSARKCVKTHYQMYFFERDLDAILEKYDILYIVRDPRDTMVACFNYYNNTNFERFVKEPSFSKFLRAELWTTPTEVQPFSFSFVKPRNIVDKWNKHVLSWMHYEGKGVTFVRFRDLKEKLSDTLRFIESRTSQRLRPAVSPVLLEDSRYRPDFKSKELRRGQTGIWRDYFTKEDLTFFDSFISEQTRKFMD
jgi:hypothetical protein